MPRLLNTPSCARSHNITKEMSLILYGVPTAPGWSRVYVSFAGRLSGPSLPNAPGMPPVIRMIVNTISKITPLFHALTQNNIIGEEAGEG